MNNLSDLIKKMDFRTLAKLYIAKILAKNLSFNEGRILAYEMLLNEEWDDELIDYSTELLEELRHIYPKEWSEDWKNDVFLGDACLLSRKYDERYEAYKRAYEKIKPTPPFLLLSIAGCYLSFKPLITIDEAEKLTLEALDKEVSERGVVLIRGIYASKNDQAKFDYWDKIFQELEQRKLPSGNNSWPAILFEKTT